jgi:hypothetical protein
VREVLTQAECRAIVDRMYREAIARGSHSETPPPVVCQGCRRYCDGYFHKTMDGLLFGRCCTPPAELKRVEEIAAAARQRRGQA